MIDSTVMIIVLAGLVIAVIVGVVMRFKAQE